MALLRNQHRGGLHRDWPAAVALLRKYHSKQEEKNFVLWEKCAIKSLNQYQYQYTSPQSGIKHLIFFTMLVNNRINLKKLISKKNIIISTLIYITLQGDYAYADQDSKKKAGIEYWGIGAKAGISGSSFWSTWKNFDFTGLDSVGIKGKVKKHSFLENPGFTGSICVEFAENKYIGAEVGVGYLRQGGTLVVDEQQNLDQSYLKIINHTVFLSGGMCIYPLSLRPNTGIWKICLTGVFNFIPKRIWLVKNSNNSKEEKFEPTGDLATLLAKGDIALSLGTAYEWDSGLYLDLRGILGFLGMLRTKIGEIQNYSQIEGERSRYEAYKRLGSKCEEENMKNYCFTLTIGYQLFKKFKNEDEDI